ncbi:hypothetical protein EV127DRAFT_161202 [Xylaria flabelliformis]|nr:hypothetical protein EV127DRAFT_161202 [Xylaria flabelliformis]
MEPPSKRLRLDSSTHGADHDDGENEDELSMTPAQFDASQDPMYQLDKKRAKAATRLKSTFENIFEKYGKDFDGDDDLVNWYTDEVEVDNGHINLMEARLGSDVEDLSGEEDERILSGKSDGRAKRPKSQLTSLIPTSHTKHKPTSRLPATSPWNVGAGPGTYRLSSLAFSPPPYNAYPPFNFGPTFENGPVDPTWQAPDLPVQPHRQHISLIGAANSYLDPFGASPHHTTKRLVSAKSFLLPTAPTSSTANNSDVEEDDILLGEYNQGKQPIALSSVSERMPVASCASSNQSSQRSGQQPPFYGIDLNKDGAHDQTDDLRKGSIQDESIEPLMLATPPVPHQPAEENMQLCQTTGSSRNSSPTRPKKEQLKKSDARKSSKLHKEETNSETRLLQPHERRIEIIIPLMKGLFPAETITEQVAKEVTPIVDENAQELFTEQEVSIDSSRNVPCLQESRYTTPPISSYESVVSDQPVSDSTGESRDANAERTVQISESLMNTSRPSVLQDPPERRPKRRLEQAELPIALTLQYDEQGLENIDTEAGREPLSSPTAVDNSADESLTDGLHIEQKSNRDSEDDRTALHQRRFSVAGVGIDTERATLETNFEENVETALIDEQTPEVTPRRSPSPIDRLHERFASSTVETYGPAATEAVVSEMAILQEHIKDLPRDELDLTSVNSRGAEVLPVHPHALINEVPRHDQQVDEVLGISEVLTSHGARISALEQELGSRNPEHSAIGEITEPDSDPGKDRLSSMFEPSGTCEDQEHDAPNQPLFSSVLIDEINGLQLDSEPQDTERSPPPQDTELPDQDLSVFPVEPDAHFTSEPILPLPLRKTQSDAQHNTGIGRSPSPELGTSIEPELISRATSQISNSPTPTTPTRRRGPRSEAKPQSSHRRGAPSKRFPLSSLVPGGIDDESDDELSIAGSLSSTISRFNSPFSRTSTSDKLDLPPLWSTPRKTTRKFGLLKESASSARAPNRIHGLDRSVNVPPATDSRAGRSQSRRGRSRVANSSPLAHRVAERLLSSPTKRNRATPQRPPSLVASPHGTLRRCGEGGFVCDRDFCLTCCK